MQYFEINKQIDSIANPDGHEIIILEKPQQINTYQTKEEIYNKQKQTSIIFDGLLKKFSNFIKNKSEAK